MPFGDSYEEFWPMVYTECALEHTRNSWKYLIPFSHHEFNQKNFKIRVRSKSDQNRLNKRQNKITAIVTKP